MGNSSVENHSHFSAGEGRGGTLLGGKLLSDRNNCFVNGQNILLNFSRIQI